MDNMKEENFFVIDHYPFKIVLFSAVFLFFIKLYFSGKYLPIISNSILECMILFLIYAIFFYNYGFHTKNHLFKLFFYFAFYLVMITNDFIFFLNSVFFNDSLIMKYPLNYVDIETIRYFFTDLVQMKYLMIFPMFILIIFLISLIDLGRFKRFQLYFKYIIIIFFIFSIFILLFDYNSISNIYVNTFHESLKISDETEEIKVGNISSACDPIFEKEITDYKSQNIPKNKKILVFVIEQTSFKSFFEDLKEVSEEKNFFGKVKSNTLLFTNYYTTNQDSMTSFWTMMDSRFIPFECYSNDWTKKYGYVLESNNLVDFFNSKDYHTHMVSAVFLPGLIQDAHNWTNATFLRKGTNEDGFYCLHEYEYEPGCEDNIILEDTKRVIKENRDNGLFMVQEFIYGHGENYLENIKKTNTEYANDYLLDLYDFMDKEGLLNDTMIIVTADHGEKGYYEKELWNYQVPFMIIDRNIRSFKENDLLYSHLYFKDILLSYLNDKEAEPAEEEFFVGQTQSSEIGYIDSEGDYFLGKTTGDNSLRIKTIKGLTAKDVTDLFKMFKGCQYESINKSSIKDFQCLNCDDTMKKAGLMNLKFTGFTFKFPFFN